MSGNRSPKRSWFSAWLPSAGRPAAPARVPALEMPPQPAAALDLVAKEQLAVAQGLPLYLDAIREESRSQATLSAAARHQGTTAALNEIARLTSDLATRVEPGAMTERVSQLAERNELLGLLGDSIRELADTMEQAMTSGALATLTADLAEGLHVVLLSAIDVMETPDETNLEILHHLTMDRGQLMESLRRSLLRGEHTLTVEDHQALFTSTRLFERVILLLRQLQSNLARP